MLADWYFCNAIRLTPSATHGFLDLLAALRDRTDDEVAAIALDELERAEASVLFYAVPDILAARRSFDSDIVQERAAARLAEAAAAAGSRSSVARTRGDSIHKRVRAIAATAVSRDGDGVVVSDRPYLDTADFGAEILMLAELADLCAEAPGADVVILAEPALATLVERACRNDYGRLPLLLACRVLTRNQSDRVAQVLRRSATGLLALEPDLLAALARARFGVGRESGLAAVSAESADHRLLAADLDGLAPVAGRRLNEVRVLLGCDGARPERLTAAVWQLVLAEVTLLADRRTGHQWLHDWLRTPPSPGGTAAGAADEDVVQAAGHHSTQPTPWIYRQGSSWVAKPKKDPKERAAQVKFRGCADPVRLLTLLGAALAAAGLVVADQPDPENDTGLEFLLHTADVLADPLLRDTVTNLVKGQSQDVRPMSLPLAALAIHVHQRVSRIGTCRSPREHVNPDRIATLITTRVKHPPRGREAAKLYDTAAAVIVTDWVFNAVSGSTGVSKKDGSNRWFADASGRPPARRLLAWIVATLSERGYGGLVSRQQLLLGQLWPEEPLTTPADWPSRLAESGTTIGAQELLLTPTPAVAVWEELGSELADRLSQDGAASVAATERLVAVLTDPEWPATELVESWADDWTRLIDAVHSPRTFRRDLRRRLVQLFALPAVHDPAQRLLRAVLEKVIDNIVEFSFDAPNDLWRLAEALRELPETSGVRPETLQLLRARFLHVATALGPGAGSTYQLVSPYWARGFVEGRRVRTRIIERLLSAVAGTVARTSTEPVPLLGEIYRSTVRQLALEGQSVENTVRVGRGNPRWPDERWLVSVLMDHANQAVRCGLLDRATPDELSSLTDATVMSWTERQRWTAGLSTTPAKALGMVCAVPTQSTRSEPGVWVNVGLTEPVWTPTRLPWSVGEPVEVTLTRTDPDEPVTATSPKRLRPTLLPDQVREAVVRSRQGTAECGRLIDVEIVDADGVWTDGCDDAVRKSRHRHAEWVHRWDPDTSAAFRSSAEVRTLARWDVGDRCWYPVDRTMAELVAELGAAGGEHVVTVVGTLGARTDRTWRLSTAPGVVYLVDHDDWTDIDRGELAELRSVAGLRLRVRLVTEHNRARLALAASDGIDDRNLVWADLFDEPESLVAELDDGMWRFAVRVPGFAPTSLVVTGLDDVFGVALCAFVVRRWDAIAQRRGRVEANRMERYELTRSDDPAAGNRFERLADLRQNDVLTLTRLLGRPRRGAWLARTTDGMVVRVAPESITMRPIEDDDYRLDVRQKKVVVTGCVPWRNVAKRTPRPLSDEELFGRVVSDDVIYAAGVCAMRPVKLDHPGNVYTVWLRLADEILVRTMPESAFSVIPTGVGDPVDAERGPDGRWRLRAAPQTVYVEALWEAVRGDRPDREDVYLGTTTVDGEPTDLFQSTAGGRVRLRLTPAGPSRQHLEKAGSGKPLVTAGNSEATVYGRRAEVTLPGGGLLHGETDGREDGLPRQVTELRVNGKLADLLPGNRWWRLTRHIAVRVANRAQQQRHVSAEHEKNWRKHLAKPLADQWLTGSFTQHGDQVKLSTLYVKTANGSFTDVVPLDADCATWVTGDYLRNDVRIVLVEREGNYHASYSAVTPLTLDDLVDDLRRRGTQIQPAPGELQVELRYAGRVNGDVPVHRFEWGYGWRAEVPEDWITIAGQPVRDNFPLFYGDVVRRVGFPRRDGRYGLDLVSFSIEHDVETLMPARQIHFEATKGIVHRIEVEVSLTAGTAWVRVVHGRQERLSDDERDDTRAVRLEHAELDQDTVDWLLERAAARPEDGPRRCELLAELDHEKATKDCGATMRFTRVTRLRRKQRLFMIAGDIVQRDNDVHLELRLPPNLEPFTGARSTARVNRRVFAHREGLLRSLHRKDPTALRGAVLLVEVMDDPEDDRAWQGTTRIDLGRRLAHLSEYVEHHRGRCYAVLTRVRAGQVGLEFKPGAYFSVPIRSIRRNGQLEPGSVVRIAAAGLGLFELFRAVPDDREYLPEPGRPAVAFPKQPLLWNGAPVTKASEPRMFTVGGLPSLQATANSPGFDGKDLMRFRHPKIVVVCRTDRDVLLRKADMTRYPVGSVVVDRDGVRPLVRLRDKRRDDVPVSWAQLSFADEGAWRIAESFEQRDWSYHDRRTGYWPVINGDRARFAEQRLTEDTVTTAHGPVFFTDKLALRYPEKELSRFGFSASDAIGGLSDEFGPSPQEYVVAAPAVNNGGLWVETFPGRVIELSADLLVAGPADNYRPLRMLDWTRFAAGDKVRLSLHHPDDNQMQVSCVALHSWAPGPRGAFRGSRTLLPIKEVDHDGMKLVLGHGRNRLEYPVTRAQLPKYARAVWLGQDNSISMRMSEPRPDDVVLLGHSRTGELFVHGLRDWAVEFAGPDEKLWPDSEWLRIQLAGTGRAHLMSLSLHSLPVTVEEVGDRRVVVSRRLQPAGRVRPRRWVRAQVLGLLDEERVLLRAGASLLTVDPGRLVPGMPASLVSSVVGILAQERRPKWFHADERGDLRGGLPASGRQPSTDTQVEPMCAASGTDGKAGLLCAQSDTASLRWLPASELGWVSDLTIDELRALVEKFRSRRMTCLTRPDGTLSVVSARDMERRLSALGPGDTFRITLEIERPAQNGRRRFVGRYYQADVLVEFETDNRTLQPSSAPLSVEIATLVTSPRRKLTVVESGLRRIALDLPRTLVAAIGERSEADARPEVDDALVETVIGGDRRLMADALRSWLHRHREAVFGENCLDAAALVAAALAADATTDPRLAVWLTWQAGVRAIRSWHVEPIAETWLGPGNRLSTGEWQRLKPVAGMLEATILPENKKQISDVCRGIISRSRVRRDPQLRLVALALLAAIGEPTPMLDLEGSLSLLAPMGRALTPPLDMAVAQPTLLPEQRDVLRRAFAALASSSYVIPLLPQAWPLPPKRQRLADQLLIDALATVTQQ